MTTSQLSWGCWARTTSRGAGAPGVHGMCPGYYSDYDPNDWCWVSGRCPNINNYYRANPECQMTHEHNENCAFTDSCNMLVNKNYPTNPKKDYGNSVISS